MKPVPNLRIFCLVTALLGVTACVSPPPQQPMAFVYPNNDIVTASQEQDPSPEALAELAPAAGGSMSEQSHSMHDIMLRENAPGTNDLRNQETREMILTPRYHSLGLVRSIPYDY